MLGTLKNQEGPYEPAALVQGSDGDFYGVTQSGGNLSLDAGHGAGTVFKTTPNGTLTTLVTFEGSNGAAPRALALGNDGNFYGVTSMGGDLSLSDSLGYGTVFKMTPDGVLTTLVIFNGSNGANPIGALVQGAGGGLYGTTGNGGTNQAGTVFKISTDGTLTSLYSFTGANDGGNPIAGLVQGHDGNFYGTTDDGGAFTNGTVFKISTNGALTSLYSFTGGRDGAYPQAGLVQGRDGNFYGTTSSGGDLSLNNGRGCGTVFRIVMPPPPPTLNLALNGNQLVLSWPTNAAGFTLQSSSDLSSSAAWTDFTDSPFLVADQYFVTNSVSGPAQFYRLKK